MGEAKVALEPTGPGDIHGVLPIPSFAQIAMVVLVSLLVTGLASVTSNNQNLGIDFVQYWSAAQVLRAGGNPYDEALLLAVQREYYPSLTSAIRMWNPPIALTVALPLSWLEYRTALVVWMNVTIITTGLAFLLLVAGLRVPSLSRRQVWFLGAFLATFFPAASALAYGQISPVLLAGFIGWLSLRATHPRLAGMALSLTLCKPHLLYLVYIALLVESARNKRFSEIRGVLIGATLLLATPLLLQPEILSWYIQASASPPIYFQTPTIGSWLQRAEIMQPEIARSLPTILLGSVFLLAAFLRPFMRFRMELLAAFSVVSSPYGWPFDQILLLPLALKVVHQIFEDRDHLRRRNKWISGALLGVNMLGIATAAGNGMEIFVWYPVAMATIYLCSKSRSVSVQPTSGAHP